MLLNRTRHHHNATLPDRGVSSAREPVPHRHSEKGPGLRSPSVMSRNVTGSAPNRGSRPPWTAPVNHCLPEWIAVLRELNEHRSEPVADHRDLTGNG